VRRLAAFLLGLLVACGLLTAGASPAFAHAALVSTSPGDGEILQQSPAEVQLTFGEPVGTGLGAIRVLSDQGDRVDTGDLTRTAGGTVVHVKLSPELRHGTYVVVWRVMSADSHPVSGAFTFVVGRQTVDPASLLGRGDLTRLGSTSKATGFALGVTRFVGFSAMLLFLGAGLFAALVSREVFPRIRRLLVGAAVAEAVAALFGLLIQGPYAAGLSLAHTFDTDLAKEVLKTTYGHMTGARVVLGLVALLVIRTRAWDIVAMGLVWAFTWANAGHAGAGKWQPTALVVDVLHVGATAAWLGGLVVLLLGLRRRWYDEAAAMPRWSRLATWSVVALVVTGTFASLRQVGELGALTSTDYGQRLLIKVALVGLMLLFALVGRAYVRDHFPGPAPTEEETAGVRRSVSIEAALGIVVVAVTALLVNTTPADAAFAPPYTGKSTAGPLTVAVDVYPARKGINGLHVYTVGAGGRTQDVAEVTGSVVHGDDRITVHLTHKSLGHYEDLDLVLPAKGDWRIELQVRTSDVDSYETSQTFTVR
jgi:copper transport protein